MIHKSVYLRWYVKIMAHGMVSCNNIVRFVMCICIGTFCLNIKAVEGSGSEGASKYMGEGVTYGVFRVVFLYEHACRCVHVRLLTCGVGRRAQLLTSSRRNVVIGCHVEH